MKTMRTKSGSGVSYPAYGALAAGAVLVLAVVAYGTWVALPFIEGPALALEAPRQTGGGVVVLSGSAARVSRLTINELEVPLTDDGRFVVERAYPAGYTVVTVTAFDRFGRSDERTLTFITNEYASEKENDSDDEENTGEAGDREER